MKVSAERLAAIGLGSNLGDRAWFLGAAVAAIADLPGTRVLAVSRWIETEPQGGPAGQGRFLNGALLADTALAPQDLLKRLHAIESAHGRDRARSERHGPRTLDLDLLVHGRSVIDAPGLRLPHPGLAERAFVLDPLEEIAPDLVVPGLDASVRALRARLARAAGAAR